MSFDQGIFPSEIATFWGFLGLFWLKFSQGLLGGSFGCRRTISRCTDCNKYLHLTSRSFFSSYFSLVLFFEGSIWRRSGRSCHIVLPSAAAGVLWSFATVIYILWHTNFLARRRDNFAPNWGGPGLMANLSLLYFLAPALLFRQIFMIDFYLALGARSTQFQFQNFQLQLQSYRVCWLFPAVSSSQFSGLSLSVFSFIFFAPGF